MGHSEPLWLAGGLAGWLTGWLMPRKAQKGHTHRPKEAQRGGAWIEHAYDALGCRLPTNRFTAMETPHRFLCGTEEEAPADYICTTAYIHKIQTEIHSKPRASPQAQLRPARLPTSRITSREAPHKHNYDQGPTHSQNYDQGPGWLAGGRKYNQGTCRALGWLTGWGAGWLAG